MEQHRILETVLETNTTIGRIVLHNDNVGALWRIDMDNDEDNRAHSSAMTDIMVSAKIIAWKRCMILMPNLATMPPTVRVQKYRTMLIDTILECNPTLCQDRTFWLRLMHERHLRHALYPLIRNRAPHSILADRHVMMVAVRHVKQTVQFVDSILWSDRSFVEYILFGIRQRRRTNLLEFIPHAVQCQWPRLIAQFVTVSQTALPSRHSAMASTVTPDLWHNRDFVLSWLDHGNPIVEQFSFVEKWKTDKDIFLAIQNFDDTEQIQRIFPSLIKDRDFMLQAVTANAMVYQVVLDSLKGDFAIALASVLGNPTNINEVPLSLLSNREFMMKALKGSWGSVGSVWHKLLEEFKSDPDFARAIPKFFWKAANDVLERCPQLRNDQNLWWQIVSTYNDGSLEYIISHYASPEIRADRTIMLRAGHTCEHVFRHVHSTLWQDPTFMEEFLSCARNPLVYLPQQIQSQNTDLVIQLFPRCRQLYDSEIALAARRVPHQLWQNRTIALQWFASGGMFFDDCFPLEWKDDREIFLLIAANRHCDLWPWSRPSQSLTSDKAFMLQAVEINLFAYFLVAASLSKDFDILVAALRHCIVHSIRRGNHPKKEFLEDLHITVRNKLRSCNNFLNIVLPAITDELQGSNMSILNQGLETSAAYVRLIADYLDVPIGKEAQNNLQRAFQTLSEILSSPY